MAKAETTTKEKEADKTPILSRLRAPAGAVKRKMRVGRGPGSGKGKTSGRGQKGQKARQPGNIHKLHFEGGQMPLNRRLPKVGFNNIFSTEWIAFNVRELERFETGSTIDIAAMKKAGLVKGEYDGIKILGNGDLKKKLTVKAHGFSASAKSKIEAAGGTVVVLEMTQPKNATAK